MASVTRRPGQVMGMHFFVPANIMTVLENVKGAATDPRTVATVMTFGRKIGKVIVYSQHIFTLACYNPHLISRIVYTVPADATYVSCTRLLSCAGSPWPLQCSTRWIEQWTDQHTPTSTELGRLPHKLCQMERWYHADSAIAALAAEQHGNHLQDVYWHVSGLVKSWTTWSGQ